MRYGKVVLVMFGCAALYACAPDHVMFVTDTSLGINVESKPATASIAYDRTEGFIGPRYSDGTIPPVVASLQTGGNVFNPAIRQFYATGNAAVLATSASSSNTPPRQPASSSGPSSNGSTDPRNTIGKLAFFGTSTTIGVKVGFDGQAPLPDSFVFGYRRKEFSFIPVDDADNGTGGGGYSSTLASIDSNTSTSNPAGVTVAGPGSVGLSATQFFATGIAADNLATNPGVARAMSFAAATAASATLSPTQAAQVQALVGTINQSTSNAITKISANLPDDASFPATLSSMIDKAAPALSPQAAAYYKKFASKSAFLTALLADASDNAANIAAGIP